MSPSPLSTHTHTLSTMVVSLVLMMTRVSEYWLVENQLEFLVAETMALTIATSHSVLLIHIPCVKYLSFVQAKRRSRGQRSGLHSKSQGTDGYLHVMQ